jgi:hypothetical protein
VCTIADDLGSDKRQLCSIAADLVCSFADDDCALAADD